MCGVYVRYKVKESKELRIALLEQDMLLVEHGILSSCPSSSVEYNTWPGTHQDVSSQMYYLCITVIIFFYVYVLFFFESVHHFYLSLFKKEICCV